MSFRYGLALGFVAGVLFAFGLTLALCEVEVTR